jgi:hypothetical protein
MVLFSGITGGLSLTLLNILVNDYLIRPAITFTSQYSKFIQNKLCGFGDFWSMRTLKTTTPCTDQRK